MQETPSNGWWKRHFLSIHDGRQVRLSDFGDFLQALYNFCSNFGGMFKDGKTEKGGGGGWEGVVPAFLCYASASAAAAEVFLTDDNGDEASDNLAMAVDVSALNSPGNCRSALEASHRTPCTLRLS